MSVNPAFSNSPWSLLDRYSSFGKLSNLPVETNTSVQDKDIPETLIISPADIGAQKDANGKLPDKIKLTEQQAETALFKHFGFDPENSPADYLRLIRLLPGEGSLFDRIKTEGSATAVLNKETGNYELQVEINADTYQSLQGNRTTKAPKNEVPNQNGTATETFNSKQVINRGTQDQLQRVAEQRKLQQLLEAGQVFATGVGAPTKLSDRLPMWTSVPAGITAENSDSILLAHINQKYGAAHTGGNLYGDKTPDILKLAKEKGVAIENIKVEGGVARFEITVENFLKLKAAANQVQSIVNTGEAGAREAMNKTAAQSFMRGFFSGASGALQSNANLVYEVGAAITDPLGTAWKVGEAIAQVPQFATEVVSAASAAASQIAKLTPAEMATLAKELAKAGYKELENLEGAALFERLGEVAGAVAVEAVLGKGLSLAFKAFRATSVGAQMIDKAADIGKSIGARVAHYVSDEAAAAAKQRFWQRLNELGVTPNNVSNIALDPELWASVTQTAANKLAKGTVKFAEFSQQMVKDFGEAVKPHLDKLYKESFISLDLAKGKTILDSSGKVIDEAIIKQAKETVVDLVKQGRTVELDEYFEKTIKNQYGKELLAELRETREQFAERLQETARLNVDVHDLLGGHIRDKHIGRSETWLRKRLDAPDMVDEDFASSFYNEATANRALGTFVKEHKDEIEAWLKDPNTSILKKTFDFGELAGIGVERGKSGHQVSNKVFVMLTKDSTSNGWHFVTAFPEMR